MSHLASSAVLFAAGVAAYCAALGFTVWVRQRHDRAYAYFALLCGSIAAYWLATHVFYLSGSVDTIVPALRRLLFFAVAMTMVYPWFVASFAGRSAPLMGWGSVALGAVLLVLNGLMPFTFMHTSVDSVQAATMPWGEVLYRDIGERSAWGTVFFVWLLSVRIHAIALGAKILRTSRRRRGHVLIAFGAVDVMGLIVETLVVFFDLDLPLVTTFSTFIIIAGVTMFFSDELRTRTDSLQQSEEKFRRIAENSLVGILVLQEGVFRYVNEAVATMLAYSVDELLALGPGRFGELVHPDDRPFVVEQARKKQAGTPGAVSSYEFRIVHRDGTVRWLEVHSSGTRYGAGTADVAILLDVTDRRQLEQQLLESRKLEAIGQLAGGMAHDFNNILQAMLLTSDVLIHELPDGSSSHTSAVSLRGQAERGAGLTQQLLAFSRRQPLQLKKLDLEELIAAQVDITRRLLGEHIVVELTSSQGMPWVRADRTQMEQLVLNLCINARDAMPTGGRLSIALSHEVLNDNDDSADRGLEPGHYASLSFTDIGLGMDEQTQARIFEPFFTTKVRGAGTGLGLATVYGVIRQHRGTIEVESSPGNGSTFTVYLPAASDAAEPATATPTPSAPPRGGAETILLVEDDPDVRNLSARLLSDAGYDVLPAADGAQALQLFVTHAEKISLAIIDLLMPGTTGSAIRDTLVEQHRDLRVLFVSGYDASAATGESMLRDGDILLQKPYEAATLLHRVRELLG